MGCSEAQLAANRANAAKSSGPKTEAGKERSRRNSLRHGLTGAGIVLPTEDVAEIEARFADFEADLKPEGGVARFLVRRAAMLSVRLDRSALHEAASLTTSILALDTDKPVDIEAGMEELFESLVVRPESVRMELISQSEGVDRLVAALVGIRRNLEAEEATAWSSGHSHLLEALLRARLLGAPGPIEAAQQRRARRRLAAQVRRDDPPRPVGQTPLGGRPARPPDRRRGRPASGPPGDPARARALH